MAIADTGFVPNVREQLLDRRARLEGVLGRNDTAQLNHLLQEVDQALQRIDVGKFGVCEVCHDPIESERLLTDPLMRVCLGCLSPAQQRALEYDLELAAQIQNGLLPPPDLSIPGWEVSYHYRAAGVVSGDYCDLMSDGKGGLYFVIADVAGKGVAAAMLSANLRAMFRTLIPLNLGTEQLLAHASRLFCESKLPTQYATLVFGRTTATGELEIVNAGHPPALLVQQSGITVFESTGLPLGMFCNQQFTASRSLLGPGDTLVLYTDGISETQNLAGEEYGNQALRALIEQKGLCCPENLVAACREHLDAFRGACERHDDETLLAVQFAPTAEQRLQSNVAVV
jgi:sigma-B regulation protein RsbU (phosphoserine phosphatase)